ncbi:MAG: hypothetical protein LBG08_06850 [Spirochaetaceae bacterium]|jgi:hypothetical protein|nr:hypothetical protein [Spirochaetaceae bacterium]
MIKRSLVLVLIAVVSAVFLVTACKQGTDSGSSSATVIGGRLVDITVDTEAALAIALKKPEYQVIGVIGDEVDVSFYVDGSSKQYFTEVTEIPAGKTVVLYRSVTPGDQFEVKGTLVVEGNGVLVADATHRVRVTDGNIEVVNGTIQVDSVVDIHGQDIQIQILGTGKAYFADGTLDIQEPLATLDDVKTAFGWVPKGTLVVTGGVTQPVKPSDLTKIQTTAIRRLEVTAALNAKVPDTTNSLTVPAGMKFSTPDPLTSLEALTVAGNLTLSAATLTNVTELKVSGALAADAAIYDQVTSLVVDSEFDAGAKAFTSLQSLRVNAGGEFTTTGNIGSAAADAAGITIEAAGKASVGAINKLKASVITGSLSATGFTVLDPATENTLSAAAGGAINGVKFPAAALISALATDAVTIEDYTVPRNETLDLAAGSTLTIAATKALTFELFGSASGEGVIVAQGDAGSGTIKIDATEGYTTTADGVAGGKLRAAVTAFSADTGVLTANTIDLKSTFYSGGADSNYYGIGSVTLTAVDTGVDVSTTVDGSSGTVITLVSTELRGTIVVAKGGADASDVDVANFTPSIVSDKLQVADSAYASSTAKVVIVTFSGVKLVSEGLINAAVVPDFSIGVKTSRS